MSILLSTDLDNPTAIPYFLWDEPMTVAEFRQRLRTASLQERTRLLAKVLREGRDTDVWRFTTPAEVRRQWPELSRHLGRRRGFWSFLLASWQREGLASKPLIRGSRVDPPEEILANKLCTLLLRSETRDLVDVRALELAGYRVDDAIGAAAEKDSGLTPAQLGWVLSEMKLGEDASPPGDVSIAELNRYLNDLIDRLTRMAFPA